MGNSSLALRLLLVHESTALGNPGNELFVKGAFVRTGGTEFAGRAIDVIHTTHAWDWTGGRVVQEDLPLVRWLPIDWVGIDDRLGLSMEGDC